MSFFGTDGKPCLHNGGYAGWKATYNDRGNMTSQFSFGTDGKPCLNQDGVAGWKATYDERGNKTSVLNCGTDGKPCLSIYGIAETKFTFDERGIQTSRSYFGVKGDPIVAPKLGYHCVVAKYDSNGNYLGDQYLDCQGYPLTYAEALAVAAKSMPAEPPGPPKA